MHEATLRDFFTGAATANALRDDLAGTAEQMMSRATRHHIVSLEGEFKVTGQHVVRLCDAVLAGSIQPRDLATTAFA